VSEEDDDVMMAPPPHAAAAAGAWSSTKQQQQQQHLGAAAPVSPSKLPSLPASPRPAAGSGLNIVTRQTAPAPPAAALSPSRIGSGGGGGSPAPWRDGSGEVVGSTLGGRAGGMGGGAAGVGAGAGAAHQPRSPTASVVTLAPGPLARGMAVSPTANAAGLVSPWGSLPQPPPSPGAGAAGVAGSAAAGRAAAAAAAEGSAAGAGKCPPISSWEPPALAPLLMSVTWTAHPRPNSQQSQHTEPATPTIKLPLPPGQPRGAQQRGAAPVSGDAGDGDDGGNGLDHDQDHTLGLGGGEGYRNVADSMESAASAVCVGATQQ
jgi:hypothetical protein